MQTLKTSSRDTCQDYGPDRIGILLSGLRAQMIKWFSGTVRMRIGIIFGLHTTTHVEGKLSQAWEMLRVFLDNATDMIRSFYEISIQAFQYLAGTSLLIWPLCYALFYLWGPITFDNFYVPIEESFPAAVVNDDIQIVPHWRLTLRELFRIIRSFLFTLHLFIILTILSVDYYFTKFTHWVFTKSIELLGRYQECMLGTLDKTEIEGLQWIGQLISQQLSSFQQAAGIARLTDCLHLPPSADYSHGLFFVAWCYRLAYSYANARWRCLPAMICARFYRQRHDLRMRQLKIKYSMLTKGNTR